ncbi:MAG: bifunctional oligoribonuclease/PAP phosphatase NrnA [Nitrospinota bacterium]|nr:bifunctional oligoribonuclease/PAP phosphatase NrnA [Nitrospinota bacterium]
MSFSEAAGFIREHGRFLITSHVNPDGDGIGAMMGLDWVLRKLGKQSVMVLESPPPEIFGFLAGYSRICSMEGAGDMSPFDIAILVDSPTMERVGRAVELIAPNAAVLNVDHHISNKYFGQVNLVEPTFSSSAEMIYKLALELGLTPDRDCAEYLYTGMIIDTGRFRFSNTSPATLLTAAALVQAGVRPDKVSEGIYDAKTLETTRALGRFIDSIQIHLGGRAAVGAFEHDFIASEEYRHVETEGFVNHALSIRGVEVAAFLKEVEQGKTRASLRSRGGIDVNRLASVFGGGGHTRAAGCTIMAPLDEARQKLLEQMAKGMD